MLLRRSGVVSCAKRIMSTMSTNVECSEIKIPVPWGEIVGKWWGSREQKPILTLHGWQVRMKFKILNFEVMFKFCMMVLRTGYFVLG